MDNLKVLTQKLLEDYKYSLGVKIEKRACQAFRVYAINKMQHIDEVIQALESCPILSQSNAKGQPLE